MQERIKVIAEKTGIYKLGLEDETAYWVLQNFSEALIRECAEIALRESHEPYECILNHFGLK